jgi:hypothetical protein
VHRREAALVVMGILERKLLTAMRRRLIANPSVIGEGLGCDVHQSSKRVRRAASPLLRATQPMEHVFLRISATKKPGRSCHTCLALDMHGFQEL